MIRAYAAREPKAKLEPFEYDPGPLSPSYVEIDVRACPNKVVWTLVPVFDNYGKRFRGLRLPGRWTQWSLGRKTFLLRGFTKRQPEF